MSNSKMLIDASHPEETRVVVLKGNRVEEFDFESATKRQLRGNIYLAKVTRVEPSLQAAFVEYGGNRHGFLAFSEIHPDYYQIPFADRQALLEEEARAHRDEEDEGRADMRESRGNGDNRGGNDSRGHESRGEGRNGGGEGRGGRGDRNDRGGRQDRGDRNQRRSRRHRRDASAPLDRRGPADDSVSEPAFDTIESDDAVAVAGVDATFALEATPDAVTTADIEASDRHEESSSEPHVDLVDPVPDVASARDDASLDATAPDVTPPEVETRHGSEIASAEVVSAPPATVEAAHDQLDLLAAADLPASTDHAIDSGSDAVVPATVSADAAEVDAVAAPHAGPDVPIGEPVEADQAGHQDAHEVDQHEVVEARDGRRSDEHQDDEHHADEHHADEHHADDHHAAEDEHVEQIGGDALSDVAPRPTRLRRHYKIQEVIKRRQILLIQVVKEERGNKGAALTTYLSLAGRYSVLMPNTAKGGGISRKITDGEDRKRLKAIAQELDVPEGMGVILRTAGAARSPIEVRRDFEYLLRMWESVRELTLKSSAPTLVYEEGSLIKRSIRDLYGKEVDEIVVAGDAGFGEARDFMRMLMPGNVKSVQHYRDPQPIFAKSGVEAQLDAMFSPHVTLKSGGYLVINQTEALVAIDVNSGRSTREHNIEDTALRTNMEAADEVARQLRLRDLAGLIVVDFIDMDEGRNNRAVERRIKEALKNDRARIQIGRISHFGLLEMSRQRIRTGVLEGSTVACPHCAGAGMVRSTASIALHVLRLLEDALIKDATYDLMVRSRGEVALYVLNQKRAKLVELEQRFGVTITISADPTLTGMIYHAIERGEPATRAMAPAPRQDLVRVDSIAPVYDAGTEFEEDAVEAGDDAEGEGHAEAEALATGGGEDAAEGRRRKRRRRRRGRERDGAGEMSADAPQPSDDGLATMAEIGGDLMPQAHETGDETPSPEQPAPEMPEASVDAAPITAAVVMPDTVVPDTVVAEDADAAETTAPVVVEEAPRRRRSRRTVVAADKAEAEVVEPVAEEAPARPRRRRPAKARAAEADATAAMDGTESAKGDETAETTPNPVMIESAAPVSAAATVAPDSEPAAVQSPMVEAPVEQAQDPDRPKRSGWWQRAKASFGS